MRAAVIREHGGPEVIALEDVPEPQPGPYEVVVDVKAAGLNHLDIWVRKGGRQQLQWPHVLGSDAAGVVSAIGEHAHGTELGQEVVINPALACGCCRFCRSGEQSMCTDFGLVGMHRDGTFAERVAVPARCIARKPENLEFDEAAALGIAYTTAWRMLFTRAQIQPGETLLIHGIGGGVATAALVFAGLAGVRALVTSSADDKLEGARELGAAGTINYRETDDVAAAARRLNDGKGVDVVLDAVGAATWPVDLAAVRKGGRVVICGVTTGSEATTNLQRLYWNQISIFGSTMGSDQDFHSMLQTMQRQDVHPVMDHVFELEQVRQATRRMEEGRQMGKIALTVDQAD